MCICVHIYMQIHRATHTHTYTYEYTLCSSHIAVLDFLNSSHFLLSYLKTFVSAVSPFWNILYLFF